MFENGSGDVLATRRVEAFAECVTRLGAARRERDDDIEGRAGLAQDTNREQRAADRPDDGVNGVPRGIDPRNFVREKFQDVERARDPEDERIAQNGERLVGRAEDDPMLMDREAGDENRQVKIDAGEAGEAERDAEQLEVVHGEIMRARGAKSRGFDALF